MKTLLLLLVLLPVAAFAEKVIIEVPGMVCQMCVQGMKKNFKSAVENPEKDIIVDLDKKTVTVNLKEKISDEEIKERVVNTGYNAKKITWVGSALK
jgi:copper chaperone CopZ